MKKELKKQKIVVAISGGLDSSVAAALLKETDGFEVIGAFMKVWPGDKLKKSEERARRIAKALKIPSYVFDFEEEFKKKIVHCFLSGYKKGKTPNPCVECNKEIKFGLLLKKARQLGAKFITTGHYARIRKGQDRIKLVKAKDKNKDQSYFLWKLNQKQLKYILFPVGGYTKNEVKKMAKEFNLPLSGVSESQEICFIEKDTNDFLKYYLKTKPGNIIDTKGRIIGQHQGLWFYTIGQRKGIKVPRGPFYVAGKDLKKNILIVTKNEKDLDKRELIAKNVNWISGRAPKLPLKIKAKIRYRHQSALAIITKKLKPKSYKLIFDKSQRAITPGQSVVFYKREEVLGGGIIVKGNVYKSL